MVRLILYILVVPIVVYGVDSIDINRIYKKNASYMRARVFYMLLVASISYLVVNFVLDFMGVL